MLGLWIAVASAQPSAAQVPSIPSASEIVQVDVIVTSRRGALVRDLRREDFVLLDDGKAVPISAFQAPPARPAPGAARSAAAPDAPPAAASGAAGARDLETLVVYVDNPNLSIGGRRRLLAGLRTFLPAQLAGGRFRVLVLSEERGLRALSELTTSEADVSRALAAAEQALPGGQLALQAERTTLDQVKGVIESLPCDSGSDCVCLLPLLQNVVRSYANERQQQLRLVFARLAELAAVLGTLPGPKTLFYLSDGVEQRPGAHLFEQLGDICPAVYQKDFSTLLAPIQEYDLSRALQELAARANSARLTIYPLDGAGLQAPSLADVSQGDRRYTPSPKTDALKKANGEAGEWLLGEGTGGFPILNTNNPARALAGVADELEARYVLGFVPEREPDGRLHRIGVELKRKGLRVRHRQSYFHGDRAPEVVGRTLAALVAGIEENALGVTLTASMEAPSSADARQPPGASVRILVPLERLAAVGEAGARHGRLQVVIAVRRRQPDRAGLAEVREKEVDVPLPEPGAAGVPHEIVVSVPDAGTGELAVGVRDPVSGLASYGRRRLEVDTPRS